MRLLVRTTIQYDSCPHRRRKTPGRLRHRKRTSCDNRELEGCIQKPGNTGDCQEITRSLKRKGMIHLHPSEEVRPCQHLDFGFIAPRTMTQYIGLAKFSFRFLYNMDKQTFWPTQYFCCSKAPS